MPRPTVALRDRRTRSPPTSPRPSSPWPRRPPARRLGAAVGAVPPVVRASRDVDGVDHLLALDDGGPGRRLRPVARRAEASPRRPSSSWRRSAPVRRGHGAARVPARGVRLWSHATGRARRRPPRFAARPGLVPVRSLHVMGRSLRDGPAWPAASLDPRYAVRSFEPGRDEDAWLALNAAAFAHHPEQGSLRRADLDQRMAEPWWDPAGLILVVEAADPDVLAASHWTKVDPPGGDVGEVYVVAVAPDRQGQGLGRAVTVLGLDHLRSLGLDRVVLYVDEDNVAAVRTYAALGFEDVEVHRQFARGRGGRRATRWVGLLARRRLRRVHPHVAFRCHDGRMSTGSLTTTDLDEQDAASTEVRDDEARRRPASEAAEVSSFTSTVPTRRIPARAPNGRFVGAGAPERRRGRPAGRPLPRARAVLAAVQRAGAPAGHGPRRAAARAHPLPRDLRQQPRRVLHGARRRPQAAHRDRPRRAHRRRPRAARAHRAHRPARARADAAARRRLPARRAAVARGARASPSSAGTTSTRTTASRSTTSSPTASSPC